jgi:hypothetical protein
MVRDRIVADNEIGWGSRAVESIDVDESMDGTVVLRIQRLRDLERDSLLSWATAAALYGTVNGRYGAGVEDCEIGIVVSFVHAKKND